MSWDASEEADDEKLWPWEGEAGSWAQEQEQGLVSSVQPACDNSKVSVSVKRGVENARDLLLRAVGRRLELLMPSPPLS